MDAIPYKPYDPDRKPSPWSVVASKLANDNDELCHMIEQALAFAFYQGFKTADDNPRQPESMGR